MLTRVPSQPATFSSLITPQGRPWAQRRRAKRRPESRKRARAQTSLRPPKPTFSVSPRRVSFERHLAKERPNSTSVPCLPRYQAKGIKRFAETIFCRHLVVIRSDQAAFPATRTMVYSRTKRRVSGCICRCCCQCTPGRRSNVGGNRAGVDGKESCAAAADDARGNRKGNDEEFTNRISTPSSACRSSNPPRCRRTSRATRSFHIPRSSTSLIWNAPLPRRDGTGPNLGNNSAARSKHI